MRIYILEYYGGEYSDSWSAIMGAFSSYEKAMEWCHANPNDRADYSDLNIEENFSIYEMEIDNPAYVEEPRKREFFHKPEIIIGAKVRVTGYAPNTDPNRQNLLHQIGTVEYRNYKDVGVKFGGGKRVWPFSIEYLEKYEELNDPTDKRQDGQDA